MQQRPSAYDVLAERGFVSQVTDEAGIRALMEAGPVTAYVGYDPTADSLHVGHLFTLMALVHLQRCGHRPIAVLGGGTARVGDPSGKTEMRQLLDAEAIAANTERLRRQMQRLLKIGPGAGVIVDNAEWLLGLKYIDFLRDIGRHFSVNRMLSAEAYKLRMERGLSFIEFNYQLLQAYDFLELYRRYGCRLQMGGDDQWGNIVAGVDLVRRLEQAQVFGITFPLQLTATGEKMGKTAAGAVWIDADKLKPYDFYQYWVNVHDADVARMLGYFTFLPMDEVRGVRELQGAELNAAKAILAYEVTQLIHGQAEARSAHAAAQGAFGGRELPAHVLRSSSVPRAAGASAEEVPALEISARELESGVLLTQALVALTGSAREARRKLSEGAVWLAGEKVTDERYLLRPEHDGALVRVGKKGLVRRIKST